MVPLGGKPVDISDEGDDESLQHGNRIPYGSYTAPRQNEKTRPDLPVLVSEEQKCIKVINKIDTAHTYKLLDPPASHPPPV